MFNCIGQPKAWSKSTLDLRDGGPDIRIQLGEQLRCLDTRMETQVTIVSELQDFFRRRAEVELDYSKNLDKLSKTLQLRHKEQKQKRESWPLFSSYSCWQQLVSQTKTLSKDHAALSEVYSTHLVSRLQQVVEDVQRIYKRCREIGLEMQEEILRTLHELHTTMKTHHAYQTECRQAESKLRLAENQRLKMEQGAPKEKLERSKKYKLIGKEVQKRKNKYFDAKLKALKSKNEYILCLESANATIHKYFVDDISDLIDCMDFGFHQCIKRSLYMHTTAEEGRIKSLQTGTDALSSIINSMDSRHDKQRFLEFNHSAFMVPKKFEFQGQKDETAEPELQKLLCADLENRLYQLKLRLTTLRTESDEVWKTLETAESTLLEMLTAKDYDCSTYFGDNAVPASKPPETVSLKKRADRHETEEFYLGKLREYLLGTSRIARLDAKREHIRQTLVDSAMSLSSSSTNTSNASPSLAPSTILESRSVIRELSQLQATGGVGLLQPPASKPPRRKRIGRLQTNGQPKLFGGSLEEYLEATNQEIPLIIKSCIRVINLYGLHHQGIFRVSGSQLEINNFKEAFERGEDPLADVTDASDINSVAGVLKLYLRELREPLFPIIYFEQFMQLAQLDSKHEFISRMRELVQSFPRPVIIFLRYIFAFLNHLSEYSDENMMDPYNLAICFGPTLVPVPEDKDQVQYQNQVNELIKNIILFNDEIFPSHEIGGIVYEKYISREPDDNDVGDSPSDHAQEDADSEVYPSEDETEALEATAQFDFSARSERELSFKKGDHIILYSQVSNDWWKGSVNGKEGLIPDKYILVKIKDDDRDKVEMYKSSSSEDSIKRRTSSSNDSVLSETSSSHSPLLSASGNNGPWPPVIMDNTSDSLPSTLSEIESSKSNLDKEHEDQLLRVEVEENIKITLIDPPSSKNNMVTAKDLREERQAKYSPLLRRTHVKALSVGDPTDDDDFPKSFNQNRELWQQRASSHTSVNSIGLPKDSPAQRDFRPKHTPDLVMDLPVQETVKSPEETETEAQNEPESPDMALAAERFAKQNQCTLKKNNRELRRDKTDSKNSNGAKSTDDETSPRMSPVVKPQIKAKPPILRKPMLSPSVPIHLMRKDRLEPE
ncbi:SLIT-ROBO Rho GTPase-activating protein 1-like isoform X2 [Planococcus citri]|uniref:SLIT-ROBO Rho GTPase-activating protein 1-like isoform X2 n=1 Tax=Planococcus citri TaxID=170843 RepID=UPI0031F8BA50